jgi:Flp pilus assembly protein TadG
MNASFRRRKRQRGTTMLLVATILPLVLIPLVGLAIDGTVAYIVQAKLSTAADGAVLGAGRLLGTSANTEEIAREFVDANFPANFWGSRNLQRNAVFTQNLSTRTVTINASVDVPLFFMRIFGHDHSTVAVNSVATRTVSRIELVLDRSGSMSPNIGALRSAATGFVQKFTPGVDQMGLIVYGGSAFVAWPPTKTLSSTGPTTTFADQVNGQDNMLTMISAIQSGSYTATAEALYLAWQEIKKADAILGDPSRPNYIVLFTDGMPNGIAAYINDPASNSLKSGRCSPGTYNPATSAATQMKGWMGSNNSQFPPGSTTTGVYLPITMETVANTAKYWVGHTSDQINLPNKPSSGCTLNDLSDLAKIPDKDIYGNQTNPTTTPDYTVAKIYGLHGVPYDNAKPYDGYHLALASWAATYNMARTIHNDTSLKIRIFCIGYTGNGGVDATLLKRVANTLDSGDYHSNWELGKYIAASDNAGMNNAFNDIAGEILRLSR